MSKNIRLTNDMRDTFIDKVMADVPRVDYSSKVNDAAQAVARLDLPAAIAKLHKNHETAAYITMLTIHFRDRDGAPAGEFVGVSVPGANHDKVKAVILKEIAPILKAWTEQVKTHTDLRRNLRAVAYHCTTHAQLAEAFPEFARYLPQTNHDATRNLPALANVVNDFVKAGWPKGGKGCPATPGAQAS